MYYSEALRCLPVSELYSLIYLRVKYRTTMAEEEGLQITIVTRKVGNRWEATSWSLTWFAALFGAKNGNPQFWFVQWQCHGSPAKTEQPESALARSTSRRVNGRSSALAPADISKPNDPLAWNEWHRQSSQTGPLPLVSLVRALGRTAFTWTHLVLTTCAQSDPRQGY